MFNSLPVHKMSIADLYQIAVFEKDKHYKKKSSSINCAGRAPNLYIICMNSVRHQFILKEMSQNLECKTKSFRERTVLKRKMKYGLTLENRILCKLKTGVFRKTAFFPMLYNIS